MKLAEFEEIAREAAENALSDTPRFAPGDVQCRWCLAQADCQALADYVKETALEVFRVPEGAFKDVHSLSDDDLLWALNRGKAVEDWIKRLREEAAERLRRGKPVRGWKLVEGRRLRRWADTREAEPFLEAELGDDAYKPRELISPAQAEKALGKKHPDLGAYIETPEGAPTLVPESDKRPALAVAAAQVFTADD